MTELSITPQILNIIKPSCLRMKDMNYCIEIVD